jgi:benzoylformate decarboxylase
MAKSLGLEALRVTDPGELKATFSSAFSRPGTKLIEVVVSNSVN